MLDRCFRAADMWLKDRLVFPYEPRNNAHIAYRCGYAAGYERAKRDLRDSKRR